VERYTMLQATLYATVLPELARSIYSLAHSKKGVNPDSSPALKYGVFSGVFITEVALKLLKKYMMGLRP